MSTSYTPNYHLGKQLDINDNFDMSVITDNMDIIDSRLKSDADNISTLTPIVSELQANYPTLSETVSTNSSNITALQNKDIALEAKVDAYSVPSYSGNDDIIEDTDISSFRHGIKVGRFSKKFWDRNASDSDYCRGVLFAYNLNPSSSSSYLPAYIQVLIVNDSSYGDKILIRDSSGGGWSNFKVLTIQDQYVSTIDNTTLSLIGRRRGTWVGNIATEISGLSAVERGIVRSYIFGDNIAYDDSHDCMQVCETVSGVRKTRWYDYTNSTWSAWV